MEKAEPVRDPRLQEQDKMRKGRHHPLTHHPDGRWVGVGERRVRIYPLCANVCIWHSFCAFSLANVHSVNQWDG